MLRFTVEHKYCGCTRVIEGINVMNAFKINKMDVTVWNVVDVEKSF